MTEESKPIRQYKGKDSRFQKGDKHPYWKGGRYKDVNGYWVLLKPDYFSSMKGGYVLEHIFVYQEFHKCCMLPWSVVHHIIPIKDGGTNDILNLQGMIKGQHDVLHHTINMND